MRNSSLPLTKNYLTLLKKDTEDEKDDNFIKLAFGSFLVVVIVMIFWRNCIPYSLFEVWYMGKGSTIAGIMASWPIFLWGGGLTFLACSLTNNERKINKYAEDIITKGTVVSIIAGVFEEICFRWWFFYGEILGFKLINLIFCGAIQWLFLEVFSPLTNWVTLGYLQDYLINPNVHWAVGAAIIGANGKFRDGHVYLGWFGFLNSWFIGMFMFYLMFNFGLLAAILSHFIYDQIIFTIRYLDACYERSRGLC